MVVLHKVSQIDNKLPNVRKYKSPEELASAFSIQVYDPYFFPDQVKYFISMRYIHNRVPLGSIHMDDGRTVILFYMDPSTKLNTNEAIEVVEESQFALLLHKEGCDRGDFEYKINSIQMDLDETYLSQTVLAFQEEFVILCSKVNDKQEYLTH